MLTAIDPKFLLAAGDGMNMAVDRIINACRGRPHIFNLGHGVDKNTDPEAVERLIQKVRE